MGELGDVSLSSGSCVGYAGEQDEGGGGCLSEEVLSGSFNGSWVVGF